MAQFFGLYFAVLFNETPGFGRLQCWCHVTVVHDKSPDAEALYRAWQKHSRQHIADRLVAWFQEINNPLPICSNVREAQPDPDPASESNEMGRMLCDIHIGSRFHQEFSQHCRDAHADLNMRYVSREFPFHISVESVETLKPLRTGPRVPQQPL